MSLRTQPRARRALSAALLGSLLALAGCASDQGSVTTGTSPGAVKDKNAVVHSYTPEDVAALDSKTPVQGDTVVLYVNGMGCPLCVTNVDMQLERLRAVDDVRVDLGTGIVHTSLRPDDRHPAPADFKRAVTHAGLTLVKLEAR